jgi:DNA modification methylase
MINLMHGDCLELMKSIADGSVDMVLTDPPYGTTQCKWDSVIPFEPMWEQLKRVTKKNGVIVLFGSEPFSSFLRCSNIEDYKYDWVWQKRPVNFLNAKKQPLRKTERISVFGGSTYNPQGLVAKTRVNKRSNSTETNGQHGLSNISEFTNYPNDVLEFIGERGLHPTQKPVALMEYLIKTYTNQGETVLDFTMGSGTTGVACVNTGRNFIGIELDKAYFEIAKDRIYASEEKQASVQLS